MSSYQKFLSIVSKMTLLDILRKDYWANTWEWLNLLATCPLEFFREVSDGIPLELVL